MFKGHVCKAVCWEMNEQICIYFCFQCGRDQLTHCTAWTFIVCELKNKDKNIQQSQRAEHAATSETSCPSLSFSMTRNKMWRITSSDVLITLYDWVVSRFTGRLCLLDVPPTAATLFALLLSISEGQTVRAVHVQDRATP